MNLALAMISKKGASAPFFVAGFLGLGFGCLGFGRRNGGANTWPDAKKKPRKNQTLKMHQWCALCFLVVHLIG
ncbi:hypothetical protein [Oceanobacter kriegii]|uniref:hypothetical protein n=1 Tax=Oceanobacter kriegii TaxID=64972 RepID=UPI0012EBD2D6|nr:hypothetical protein [Oceanobacter kriegii]